MASLVWKQYKQEWQLQNNHTFEANIKAEEIDKQGVCSLRLALPTSGAFGAVLPTRASKPHVVAYYVASKPAVFSALIFQSQEITLDEILWRTRESFWLRELQM